MCNCVLLPRGERCQGCLDRDRERAETWSRILDLAKEFRRERNEGLSGNPVCTPRRWFPRSEQ